MDLDKNCYIPFHGITIEPNTGNITFCCQDNSKMRNFGLKGNRLKPAMNISDIDDLQKWWVEEYQDVWDAYDKGEQGNFYPCSTCFGLAKKSNNTVFESYRSNLKQGTYDWKWERGGENKIRFLEIAASNICNQMCVMCSRKHSNQWLEYDKEFGHVDHKLWRFSDEDAEKINKLIPNQDIFYMKGGDHLADQKHIEFLKVTSETSPDCTINLQTNMQGLLKRHLPIFKKLKNLRAMVSVDGTEDIYNWIRGGDWDKITKNMEILYGETGIKSQIMITISLYNFWSLDRIFEYFHDKPYTRWIQCHNIVHHPSWCSPLYLPEEVVEEQLWKLMPLEHNYGRRVTFRDFFDPISHYEEKGYKSWLYDVWNYTNKMNKIRGFDILDHVPELKNELRKL